MRQAREWRRFRPKLLKGQTVGFLCLGVIGREIARLCKAFDMTLTGIHRSAGPERPFPEVDRVYPRERLPELLAESDFVVLTLPLTKETKGLIGEKELKSMKPSACLINVARAPLWMKRLCFDQSRKMDRRRRALCVYQGTSTIGKQILRTAQCAIQPPYFGGHAGL